jgi:hypothetical protein
MEGILVICRNYNYNLGSGVAPPGFSGRPIGEGACTVAVLLSQRP